MRVERSPEEPGPGNTWDAGRAAEPIERPEHGVPDLSEREDREREVDSTKLQGDGSEAPAEECRDHAAGDESDPGGDGELGREDRQRVRAERDVAGVTEREVAH